MILLVIVGQAQNRTRTADGQRTGFDIFENVDG